MKITPTIDMTTIDITNIQKQKDIKLGHKLFIKDGNTVSIINKKSYISESIKKSTAFGQLYRIFKNSTTINDFNEAYIILKNNLKLNNYSLRYIRNIKRNLLRIVNFKISDDIMIQKGHHQCLNCVYCKYTHESQYLNYKRNCKTLTKNTNCNSSNIIYGILCTACTLLYIGETKNKFKKRFSSHLTAIKYQNINCTLYKHFENKLCFQSLKVMIIDYNPFWNNKKRLFKEAFYQKFFNSLRPNGLNDMENMTKNKFKIPLTLPHGTSGLSIDKSKFNIYSSSQKNLTRFFHSQKFS